MRARAPLLTQVACARCVLHGGAGVISLTALGLGVSEEAAQEAGSAAQCASQLLEQLFPAVLSAFRSQVSLAATETRRRPFPMSNSGAPLRRTHQGGARCTAMHSSLSR